MRKIFVALFALMFVFTGCSDNQKSSEMKPAPQTEVQHNTSTTVNTKEDDKLEALPTPEDSALPAKISKLPSIGTTLAEFERTYKPSQTDKGLFAYGTDNEFSALFWDDNFQLTNEKNARASNFAIYKRGMYEDELKDYLPSDARIVTEESKDSDGAVLYKYLAGYSDMLAEVYPQSEGQWWAGFHFDKHTGAFLYGGINAEHWNE
ncbi:MAG: hypothetical protein IJL12_08715 [Selenomonadaceae bacterium]|nr:hypothetical protein [Selenomonadaceae bacterium]